MALRYIIEVMYDGTLFHGSQIQGQLPTVQLLLNNTLSTLFRKPIETFGASRTDEGVHATSNFYHFDTENPIEFDLKYKMNAIMHRGLAVKQLYLANDPEFNVRFGAVSRQYRYRLYFQKDPFLHNRAYYFPLKMDRDLLHATALIVPGHTNFESFSKRNTQSHHFMCNIKQSRWEQAAGELHYVVEANRFLRGMVRALVATQLQVARGKLSLNEFNAIFEKFDSRAAFFDVPGHGLYLEKIEYPETSMQSIVNHY